MTHKFVLDFLLFVKSQKNKTPMFSLNDCLKVIHFRFTLGFWVHQTNSKEEQTHNPFVKNHPEHENMKSLVEKNNC